MSKTTEFNLERVQKFPVEHNGISCSAADCPREGRPFGVSEKVWENRTNADFKLVYTISESAFGEHYDQIRQGGGMCAVCYQRATGGDVDEVEEDSVLINLDEMTVDELRSFAKEEDIDLGDARLKDDIIAVIQEFND